MMLCTLLLFIDGIVGVQMSFLCDAFMGVAPKTDSYHDVKDNRVFSAELKKVQLQ